MRCSAIVRDRVDYVAGTTDAHTSAAEALADGKGVCQDHAHIFISAARTLGIPARYVTGYLVLDERAAPEAHHAWAEAWVEALGWVGFDVANRICPTERYVRLACRPRRRLRRADRRLAPGRRPTRSSTSPSPCSSRAPAVTRTWVRRFAQ